MAIFKSVPMAINASAEKVYNKLSNLSNIKNLLGDVPADAIPADKREMFDAVRITDDSIFFPAGPVGEVQLKVTERVSPALIRLSGVGTPMPLDLSLELAEVSADACEAATSIDIAIPPMLKPMVGGTLQKMVDQFTQVIGSLKYE